MIKVEDLRIGNMAKCRRGNDAGIYRVLAIDGKHLMVMLDGVREGEWLRSSFYEKPEIKPIPLTEEWLLKFGFEYDGVTYNKRNCPIMLAEYSRETFSVWYKTLTHGDIDIKIKFVHQLQNLFFSLTGEELQIKEAVTS